mmetsp:Transcript_19728/g.56467  ORF Transcript_19728/g.56467 Transcript_19728/m.56467 type:complete len:433 (-) Transcript_19728:492-1790(-)
MTSTISDSTIHEVAAGKVEAVATDETIFQRSFCVPITRDDSTDEATPSTTVSECSDIPEDEEPEARADEDATTAQPSDDDGSGSSSSRSNSSSNSSSGRCARKGRGDGGEVPVGSGGTGTKSVPEVEPRIPGGDKVQLADDSAHPGLGETTDEPSGAHPEQLCPGLYPPGADFIYEEDLDEVERIFDASRGSCDAAIHGPVRPPPGLTSDTEDEDDRGIEVAAWTCELESTSQETLFVLDWDDTMLPSSWIQRQGLRLDEGSEIADWQQELLSEVAVAAAGLLRMTKERGTVVLVTNAERGWIELSCRKFMPELMPCIEGVRIVSARTSYEGPFCVGPLDWKVRAFEAEVARIWRVADSRRTKNIHSIGDGVHEREALLLATQGLVNCLSKSLKFVERPDIGQLLRQHELIAEHLGRIVQHDGDLDVCISCP